MEALIIFAIGIIIIFLRCLYEEYLFLKDYVNENELSKESHETK